MAQVINTNIASLNAQRNLNSSQSATTTSLQRLSTGLRINSAKDDAAGLAISERMSTQIKGLNQAVRNSNDGISLAQTAEGALQQIGTNLQRIRELSVQSANATNSADDRAALQKEVAQLSAEIGRVAKDTSFNGTNLIDGSFTSKAFQVGANQGQTISINGIANANVNALGSWTSKDTSAVMAGTGAAGEAVAAVSGKSLISLGDITAPTAGTATTLDYAASTVTVNGMQLDVAAVSTAKAAATPTATEIQLAKGTLLTNIAKAVNDAGIPGLTVQALKADGTAATAPADIASLSFANTGKTEFVTKGSTFAGTIVTKPATPASKNFAALAADTFKVNGVSIEAIGATTSESTRLAALANAINNRTAETTVTATVDNGRLKLTSDKKDVEITLGAAALPKLRDGTTSSTLANETGLTVGTSKTLAGATAFAKGAQQTGFANLDISTVDGADNAIKAMDAALKSVNEARADLGAIQNRFSSVVSSLETTSENLSASRSRIQDTDFAAETASLTRAQILSQAGTAMLTQANSLPNNVLTLLRG
ncbi:flagellin [Pigmentiphaga litoralis]|uniref:flagellin N-terminal helical domain-containing protein n=1 Tax=Pigmentiphaga litoralis TaxID=516702 RepID=UPI003B42ED0A